MTRPNFVTRVRESNNFTSFEGPGLGCGLLGIYLTSLPRGGAIIELAVNP